MRPFEICNRITVAIIYSVLQIGSTSFIDVNHPIVISDGTIASQTSNFGYAISGFSSSASKRAAIYIGAPTSVRRSSRGVTTDAGDVWHCGVNLTENPNQHSKSDDSSIRCTPWSGLNKASKPCCTNRECVTYTSGMWLGASITAIEENDFVTCGSRWSTKIGNDRGIHGHCYHAQNGIVKSLQPPLIYEDQIQRDTGNLVWFYGQSGFSSVLDKSKTLLLAGSPGYLGWRGNAILYNLKEGAQSYCKGSTQFRTVFGIDSPRTGVESPDYFGYFVASGQYNSRQETVFAVGAPRGLGSKGKHMAGFVSIFSVNPRNVHFQNWMQLIDTLYGDQLGSYFGAQLAFADVNDDGFDEIFVGSPFYTVGQNTESFDQGCVFVYSRNGTRGLIQHKNNLVEQLCPSTDSGSHFGFAIASLGDINQDGFKDIAISAPGSAKGTGEVFIYYGQSKFPLSSHPHNPQRIGASEINQINGLKGFGSTLFGNVDLDGNGTPDILIGASSTNQVVIYRTRPRLQLAVIVTNHNTGTNAGEGSHAIYKLRRNETSFQFQFCLASQRQPSINGRLDIQVEAKMDPSEERFKFANKANILKFTVPVINDDEQSCNNIHVDRVKELEQNNPAGINVIWRMMYNDTRSDTKEITTFSVSENGQGRLSSGNFIFCTWCPKNMEQLHHHFLAVATDDCDEDGNTICNSKLKVVASFRAITGFDNTKLNTYTIGPHGSRFLDVYVENHGETAYSPTIMVDVTFSKRELSSSFNVKLTPTLDGRRRCKQVQNKVVCNDPMHRGQKEHISFTISISQTLTALENEENLRIRITAYPEPHPEQAVTSNYLELKLISDVKLTLTELSSDRKDININDAVVVFKNSYEIINSGASPLKDLHMTFQIPYKYGEEEQEVLIIYMPQPNTRISCNPPNAEGFPPLPMTVTTIDQRIQGNSAEFPNGTISGPSVSRRRRQTEEAKVDANNVQKQHQTQKMATIGNVVNLDCVEYPKWKCVEITCSLHPRTPLTSNDALTIELNLSFSKNATGSIIPPESAIFVKTVAKIWTFDKTQILSASATTGLQANTSGEIPAYLILLSGIGGLVIFFLIAFGLFKCGFFRRKTKENLQNLKAKAEQEDLLAENFHIPAPPNNDEEDSS